MRQILLAVLSFLSKIRFGFIGNKNRIRIANSVKISNSKKLEINGNVRIQRGSFINPSGRGICVLGDGVNIGPYCQISASRRIEIGKNVLIAPNVFISDHNHEYRDVELPISCQGNMEKDAEIHIDDNCWKAKNVVIVGNVRIGKHSVIGANSVVVSDIPPFSVAVGAPAKVIKKYNFDSNEWESAHESN